MPTSPSWHSTAYSRRPNPLRAAVDSRNEVTVDSPLPLAVRAFTRRRQEQPGGEQDDGRVASGRRAWKWPRHVLVFDTETAVDYSQRLNFGSWRFYQLETD